MRRFFSSRKDLYKTINQKSKELRVCLNQDNSLCKYLSELELLTKDSGVSKKLDSKYHNRTLRSLSNSILQQIRFISLKGDRDKMLEELSDMLKFHPETGTLYDTNQMFQNFLDEKYVIRTDRSNEANIRYTIHLSVLMDDYIKYWYQHTDTKFPYKSFEMFAEFSKKKLNYIFKDNSKVPIIIGIYEKVL
jgi:hypothetical protein